MEWTTEKRYLPYNKWNAEQLLNLQAQAANSDFQMKYMQLLWFWPIFFT